MTLPGLAAGGRRGLLTMLSALLLSACATLPEVPQEEDARFVQREGVLGTSFTMEVASELRAARRAVDAALAEIARLEGLLSAWRADSELSAWNDGRLETGALSEEVSAVMQLCEQWREQSDGAFSCRLGGVAELWREAARDDRVPDRPALRRQARALDALRLPLGDGQRLDPAAGLRLDVDGLAKGYILDRALARARAAAPEALGIRIDIGGDAVYWGHPLQGAFWPVTVADPAQPLDNSAGIATLRLQSRAIAASGHGSRGYRIGRRHFSHIIDPKDGWPLAYAPSAVVVAPDAVTADALATALTVMPIRDGLAWVERLDEVEALMVSESGIAFASTGWGALLEPASTPPVLHEARQLRVDYVIPSPEAVRYRRPYLAIWVEDPEGRPVRQLMVLGDRARWLSELPRWWRHYGRNDPPALHGIARPTRQPGHYTLGWDGRDDRGRSLPAGPYVLSVEAAREFGGHEVVGIPFVLGAAAGEWMHEGGQEVGRIQLALPAVP